eukprot:COSAG05_NODE_4450_length_1510_cov_1.170092_1_plen_76_part_10
MVILWLFHGYRQTPSCFVRGYRGYRGYRSTLRSIYSTHKIDLLWLFCGYFMVTARPPPVLFVVIVVIVVIDPHFAL